MYAAAVAPFLVPIFALLIPIVAILAGAYNHAQSARLKADQRMAMLARGIPIAEIESVLKTADESDRDGLPKDPLRSLGNARRTAVVLISTGLGLIVFFVIVSNILRVRPILAGAAAGLIPLAIGIGFLVDYSLQKRELARFQA